MSDFYLLSTLLARYCTVPKTVRKSRSVKAPCGLLSISFKPLEAFFRQSELRFPIAEDLAEKNLAAFNLDKLCTQRNGGFFFDLIACQINMKRP